MKKAGFIGLGIMGHAMAHNLIQNGFSVTVYNRTKEKANDLFEKGATVVDVPSEVASKSEIIFTMLSTPAVVEETAWGKEGFVPAMAPGTLWVDCSTVDPSFSELMAARCREKGIRFIEAPVGGSKIPAEKAELNFFAGGDAADIAEAEPFFNAMGKKVIHFGTHGMGASYKMVFNYCLGLGMAAFSEGMVLGEKLGLDKNMLLEILTASPVVPQNISLKKQKIITDDYTPEFPLKWLQKDLYLAAKTAWEHDVSLPVGNAAKEIYEMAKIKGMGDLDYSAIYMFLKKTLS